MGRINFDDVVILGQKTNQILIWNGKEARWKNISDIESERLRKERKEKLNKINGNKSIR